MQLPVAIEMESMRTYRVATFMHGQTIIGQNPELGLTYSSAVYYSSPLNLLYNMKTLYYTGIQQQVVKGNCN